MRANYKLTLSIPFFARQIELTGISPHGLDGDRQCLLVDDVYLLANAKGADKGLNLWIPRRDRSHHVIRADEADGISRRINRSNGYAATTDTCNFPSWPTCRLRAIDRHV